MKQTETMDIQDGNAYLTLIVDYDCAIDKAEPSVGIFDPQLRISSWKLITAFYESVITGKPEHVNRLEIIEDKYCLDIEDKLNELERDY